jgi:hypothetical protein
MSRRGPRIRPSMNVPIATTARPPVESGGRRSSRARVSPDPCQILPAHPSIFIRNRSLESNIGHVSSLYDACPLPRRGVPGMSAISPNSIIPSYGGVIILRNGELWCLSALTEPQSGRITKFLLTGRWSDVCRELWSFRPTDQYQYATLCCSR